MKKEIVDLIKKEKGSLKINNFTTLKRYTKDALGFKVDKLQVVFNFGPLSSKEIKSREYEDVIDELEILINNFFEEKRKEVVKNLKAGYLS